ncbi:MAG: class I SAM-dependent methyltransferase [Deltaproteobacteria bacterium]|nr:class I SAM-dependent methyltransferase [Deltaproteobacteria bacterium]
MTNKKIKTDEGKRFFYNRLANRFDSVMNMYDTEKRVRIVYDELLSDDIRGKKLLDAGCGTGWFSKKAAELEAEVYSSDIGTNLLKVVADKCDSRKVTGDLLALPFLPDTFSIVVCSEAIEHTINPAHAFTELVRVLAPGGTLIVTVPNRFWHWSVRLADRLKIRPYEGLENWPAWGELERWCVANNLKVESMFGFHLFPFVLKFTYPVLDLLDKFRALSPFMVNIALKATKGGTVKRS